MRYQYLQVVHDRRAGEDNAVPCSDEVNTFGTFCRRVLNLVAFIKDHIILHKYRQYHSTRLSKKAKPQGFYWLSVFLKKVWLEI